MFPAPAMPAFAPGQSTTSTEPMRYEDVAQDGCLLTTAIPPAMGGLWRDVLVGHAGARNAVAVGVIPILSRLTLCSFDQPIRVDRPIETISGFELAHERAGDQVTRIFMNVWSEVRGVAGRLSRKATAGDHALAGTLFAEHTFTRLLAPPGQRGVTRLDVEGYPAVPEATYTAPAPASAQDAPPGGRWLEELTPDLALACFTLDQTDSNQHVNSLTYVRVFQDAVSRRLAGTGRSLKLRTRAVDIAYRKPCFAGDRVRAHLRLFEHQGALGAAGHIAGEDDKVRCYVRVLLGK